MLVNGKSISHVDTLEFLDSPEWLTMSNTKVFKSQVCKSIFYLTTQTKSRYYVDNPDIMEKIQILWREGIAILK